MIIENKIFIQNYTVKTKYSVLFVYDLSNDFIFTILILIFFLSYSPDK